LGSHEGGEYADGIGLAEDLAVSEILPVSAALTMYR
jgi:hypothetical protein